MQYHTNYLCVKIKTWLPEPVFLGGAGAGVFGWSRSRGFCPAPAPTTHTPILL